MCDNLFCAESNFDERLWTTNGGYSLWNSCGDLYKQRSDSFDIAAVSNSHNQLLCDSESICLSEKANLEIIDNKLIRNMVWNSNIQEEFSMLNYIDEDQIQDTINSKLKVNENIKEVDMNVKASEVNIQKEDSQQTQERNLNSPINSRRDHRRMKNACSKQKLKSRKFNELNNQRDNKKKPRKLLSLRADVMNKSIFRAIRRECKCMFDNFIRTNKYTNSRSKRIFKANLRRFSAYLLGLPEYKPTATLGLDLNSFMIHAGVLTNNCLMKKIFVEPEEIEKISEFHELLFSYSHKRFNDYVSKPEVGRLVKIIFEKQTIEKIVSNHSTLNVNRESYTSHIKIMLNSI